jgi:sialate O-acetylesterase
MQKSFLRLALILSFITLNFIQANEWERLKNLKGTWLFKIGDNTSYAESGFDDSDWDRIHVPESWEEEGFQDYDGYAWYRKHFDFELENDNGLNFLNLGFIDDVDEVYLNGKLIGETGKFPPEYRSAYNVFRSYPVFKKDLNKNGENVIAVRVYDDQQQGGIVYGDIGFYEKDYKMNMLCSFEGYWKFTTGDNKEYSKPDFNDEKWEEMIVPSKWDNAGYSDYDGFGWYRKEFTMPKGIFTDDLILMIGKIDDIDEVYFNGKKIGSTGNMKDDESKIRFDKEYSKYRGYNIPEELINENGKNYIAVRVYDGYREGGIYAGPVGIVHYDEYKEFYRKERKKDRDPIGNFFRHLFGN